MMNIKRIFNKLFGFFNTDEAIFPKPLKEYTLFELMNRAIIAPERVYVAVSIKMFEDKCCFEFDSSYDDETGEMIFEPYNCEVPYTPGQKKIGVIVEGNEFVWDDEETFFRWIPYGEPMVERKFNNWVEYFENGELRIQKEYADHNLSHEAIEYSYYGCEDYYSWNVWDGSYAPVMFEIPSVFDKTEGNSRFEYFMADMHKATSDLSYTNRYYEKRFHGMTVSMIFAEYQKNQNRVLWESDDK
jgi:hypothetical protein